MLLLFRLSLELVTFLQVPPRPLPSLPSCRTRSLTTLCSQTHSTLSQDPSGAPALSISLAPEELATTIKIMTSLPGSDASGQLDPLLLRLAVRLPPLDLRWPLPCANLFCAPADTVGLFSVDVTAAKSVQTPWDVFVLGTLDLAHLTSLHPVPTVTPSTLAELQTFVAQIPVPSSALSSLHGVQPEVATHVPSPSASAAAPTTVHRLETMALQMGPAKNH
jgi:hypothetical protein